MISADDNILEVGSGSGYIGACLASLGGQVHSLDLNTEVQEQAKKNTAAYEISNIEYELANAFESHYDASFDVIAVTGSARVVPENLKQALKIGGRMFVIVGQSPAMQALLVTRAGNDEWNTQSLFETDIPTLVI